VGRTPTIRRLVVTHAHHNRRVPHETIVIARACYQAQSAHSKSLALALAGTGTRCSAQPTTASSVTATATLSGGHAAKRTITLEPAAR
jgi:hypothetical protein